jgi:hypothetical protein
MGPLQQFDVRPGSISTFASYSHVGSSPKATVWQTFKNEREVPLSDIKRHRSRYSITTRREVCYEYERSCGSAVQSHHRLRREDD